MSQNVNIKNNRIVSDSLPMISVNNKTLSIPIKNQHNTYSETYSKSWNGYSKKSCLNKKFSTSPSDSIWQNLSNYSKSPSGQKTKYNNSASPKNKSFFQNNNYEQDNHGYDFKLYDAINNCKSAGVIPYTIHNGTLYFLFQRANHPIRKKDHGWNDFGGKKHDPSETTMETAAREFSEETSCLFYLKEQNDEKSDILYDQLKDNNKLYYDENTINFLKKSILLSQKFYANKITEFVSPICISSKEIYISYFVRVIYIPEYDLPRAEDIHIPYEHRYIRTCKWFSIDELILLYEKDFHKRLQITKIQQRIYNYYEKGLFT